MSLPRYFPLLRNADSGISTNKTNPQVSQRIMSARTTYTMNTGWPTVMYERTSHFRHKVKIQYSRSRLPNAALSYGKLTTVELTERETGCENYLAPSRRKEKVHTAMRETYPSRIMNKYRVY